MNAIMKKEITEILHTDKNISQDSFDKVFELMYPEIKRLANLQLLKLNAGQTITPTVLVNECYLKLSKPSNLHFENRKHFTYTVARCMRQFLMDRLKQNMRQKRAGEKSSDGITSIVGVDDINIDLLDIDKIINKLDTINSNLAQLVVLKFFSGNSLEEIANIQEVSRSTIMRHWKMAKSYIKVLQYEI